MRSGYVQDEYNAMDTRPADARRTVDDARVVQEGGSVLGLAPSLEERNVEVAQRARLLRVLLFVEQRFIRHIRMDPLRARASISGDQPLRDAILMPE